jgi:hypothetical protein
MFAGDATNSSSLTADQERRRGNAVDADDGFALPLLGGRATDPARRELPTARPVGLDPVPAGPI